MEKLLSSKETSEILGVSQFTVNYTLAENEIPYIKVCNKRMFKKEDIEDYIKRNRVIPMTKIRNTKLKYVV